MKRLISILLLLCCLCGAAAAEEIITPGTQTQRGFINDNVLHNFYDIIKKQSRFGKQDNV